MRQVRVVRRLVGGTVAAILATMGVIGWQAAPAHAAGEPLRREATSDHNADQVKEVTVDCPGQLRVFAAGGRVNNGRGGVVMTRMQPNEQLTSVIVEGRARGGYSDSWSVTAYVICNVSSSPPELGDDTAYSASTASASCPGQTRLTGTGFRLTGPVDNTYVDGVVPGAGLTQVVVHTGGSGPAPDSLTAFAICHEPTQPSGPPGMRVEASTPLDGTWPQQVTVGTADHWMYAVGGTVTGPDDVYLDALVPNPDPSRATARAVRALPLPGMDVMDGRYAAMVNGSTDDEGGDVTVYGVVLDVFH